MATPTLREIEALIEDLSKKGIHVKITSTFTGIEIEGRDYVDRLIASAECVKRRWSIHSHYPPTKPE